jgi:hypothetical protein
MDAWSKLLLVLTNDLAQATTHTITNNGAAESSGGNKAKFESG